VDSVPSSTVTSVDPRYCNATTPQHQDVDKKSELMLTRCAKAYSSSCSQTVSLSPAILLQFILEVCTATKDCKSQ